MTTQKAAAGTELATRIVIAGDAGVTEAARVLAAGGLIAFPTETVYGLGADASNGEAIARLYAAKGRPAFNPLIAHVASAAAARTLARFDTAAERLAAAFWPGPLTLVLPKVGACPVAALATAGLDSVAVRVPAHPVALALLRAFGGPVVAPSANRSGHLSPTTAAHVLADLSGRIDLIVDGGATPVGLESAIVACLGESRGESFGESFGAPALLRPGGVPRAAIEAVLGAPLADAPHETAPRAPGMLASHYAPRTRLRLDARTVNAREALLAFGPALADGAAIAMKVLNLSARGDLTEAAVNLFSHLRVLDAAGAETIAVMPIPHHGLGEAINDRLRRATSPVPSPP
jgi:L-threonylcarbamoyladenylate synthase